MTDRRCRALPVLSSLYLARRHGPSVFELGDKPALLRGVRAISTRLGEAYRRYESRVSPFEVARRFKRVLEIPSVKTASQAASRVGVSRVRFSQFMALLRLSPRVVTFVDENYGDPLVRQVCTEKRLRPLGGLRDEDQWRKFLGFLRKATNRSNLWDATRSQPAVFRRTQGEQDV